jgi:tetratricopeptide (TPR) repeat protein
MKKILFLFLLSTLTVPIAFAKDAFDDLNQLFRAKEYQKLENMCQERLKAKPKSLDAYYFLSLIKLNQGKEQEAVPYMVKFEKFHNEAETLQAKKKGKPFFWIDPYYVNLYFVLGEYYVRRQQYDRAFPWLKKAKAAFADDAMMQFFLGRCYAGQGKYKQAIPAFRKQLELESRDPSPLYNIACCYAGLDDESNTVLWLKKAITVQPEFKDVAKKDKAFEKFKESAAFQELTAD